MKKFLAVLLAMAMVVSCLAGCQGGGEESKTETSKTETSKTETSSKAEESSTTEEEKPYELLDPIESDGTLVVARSSYIQYPVDVDADPLRYWLARPGNVANGVGTVPDTEWAKNMVEYTGIEIEWLEATGDTNEAFGVMSVSSELPDIVEWEWANKYPGGPYAAEADGLLIMLNDYYQAYAEGADIWQFLQDNPHIDKQIKTDDGDYYCVPFVRGSKYLQCTSGPIVRKDLLESVGVDVAELTTVDEWYDALTKAKDIEGITYPLMTAGWSNYVALVGPAFNVRSGMMRDYETGEVLYGEYTEGWKEFIATTQKWVDEGLINPDLLSLDGNARTQAMMMGEAVITYGAGGGQLGTFVASIATDPTAYVEGIEFDTLNFPVINEGDVPHYGGTSYDYATTSASHAAITADCENPDVAMLLLNWAYSQEGHRVLNFGSDYVLKEDGSLTYSEKTMNFAENGFASIATSMAAGGRANMSGPFAQDPGYIFAYYNTEVQTKALYTWNDDQDSQSTLIPPVTLTTEESSEYATIIANVNTAVSEAYGKWFNRTANVEDDWDSYLATLESLQIERAIEIYQAAVDRFDAR